MRQFIASGLFALSLLCVGCAESKPTDVTTLKPAVPGSSSPAATGEANKESAAPTPNSDGASKPSNAVVATKEADSKLATKPEEEAKPTDDPLEQAGDAFAEGDFEKANGILKKFLATHENDRSGLLLKAQILEAEGRSKIRSDSPVAVQKYEECVATYKQLDEKHGDLTRGEKVRWATANYDLACSLALAGKPEPALAALKSAALGGYDNLSYFDADDDLETVRALPGYKALIKELQDARREKIRANVAEFEPVDVDLQVTDVEGKKLSLKDFRGKIVLIDCWAT